jgi:uncharacterized DUF497 family protein
VFTDPSQIDKVDGRRDYGEERRNIVGIVHGVCITITYTMRGNVCRVISARKANRKERKEYGQDQNRHHGGSSQEPL